MAADRIHIVDTPPPACSGCFQAKPHLRHVDFGAAWDGPMLPALQEAIGVAGHSIDDLILCEHCLNDAAGLLGFAKPDEVIAERDLLRQGNMTLVAKMRQRDDYIKTLEAAISARDAAPDRPDLDAEPEHSPYANAPVMSEAPEPAAPVAAQLAADDPLTAPVGGPLVPKPPPATDTTTPVAQRRRRPRPIPGQS